MYHGNSPQYRLATAEHAPDAAAGAETATEWVHVDDPWGYDSRRAGMTWVDVVFPMFLFTMGAAIPLAYTSRLRKNPSRWRQARAATGRFLVLVLFAVYVQQVLPSLIDKPVTDATRWMSVLAFVILIPLLTRLPAETPVFIKRLLRLTGTISVVVLLCMINTREGHERFTWATYDIIILLLAWSSLVASLLWLLMPNRPWLWLPIGLVIATIAHELNLPAEHRLGGAQLWNTLEPVLQWPKQALDLGWMANAKTAGDGSAFLDLSSLYSFSFLSCLWLVLPGMLTGERLIEVSRSQAADENEQRPRVGPVRWLSIIMLLVVGMVVVLAGLQDVDTRWGNWGRLVVSNPYAAWLGLPASILAWIIIALKRSVPKPAALVRQLIGAGVLCLVVGVLLSCLPGANGGYFEGGVRKVPGTLSWYFTSTGLICHLLAIFMIIIDMGRWRRSAALLIGAGQNPMLAYVAHRNLLWPIVTLPLIGWLTGGPASIDAFVWGGFKTLMGDGLSPWWAFAWGVLQVLALATMVWGFTKLRIVWRT